ncbi:MAG: hypothetical protein M3R36_18395 [Bacteroidota bacterium]|nr:hypothetical protein [Bacteroidota bacterium]
MKKINLHVLFVLVLLSTNLQAQWERTNGPNGGYVADFAVNGSSIFAATIDGIFRSNDAGISWVRISNLGPSTICVNGTTIFAGEYSLGLYRSTDNGNSWVNITNNIAVSFISQLYVHNGILFAGTSGAGVYRSTDNGNSFQAVNNGFGAYAFINTFTSSGNLLFTGLVGNGGTVGPYVTNDNGNSWIQVINGLPVNRLSTQSLTAIGNEVYAAVNDQGVYKSINNGGSWFPVNTGLPLVVNGGVNILEAHGGIIYAGRGGEGAWKSSNNGASWINIANGLPVQTSPISFFITDTFVLVGSQYAVHKSTNNGSSWFVSYKGIANTVVTDLIVNGNSIYAGTTPGNPGYGEGVSVTSDNGNNWTNGNGGFPANISVNTLAFNGTTIFAGTINGIYTSTNSGIDWQKVDSTDVGAGVQKIIVLNNTIFAATYGKGILKSSDNGLSWQFSNTGLGDNITVYELMVDGNNLYAGIFWGVYLSTNNGASWVNKSAGIYPGSSVYSLVKSGNNLLAGTHNGLYLSSNNGSNWNLVQAAPLNSNIRDFAVSGDNVYAAADSGVFQSSNNGISWAPFNTDLAPYTNVISVTILGNHIFIGTNGKGVWKTTLPGILTLSLKAIIHGFYNPVLNVMVSDSVKIYLRNAASPYSLIDSSLSILDSVGTGNFIFHNAVNSLPYFIVIKHRNGLETWSAAGNSFISGSLSYDFTLSMSKAYGNNQILAGTKYCIYNGDVNQDGAIDISDLGLIDNDVYNFNSGYVTADVNGDSFVDISDLEIADNNAINFISLQRP